MSRKPKDDASTEELRMTIAAAPSGGIDLQHELRLVKCGLLYADRVTLCSPKASMLFAVHGLKGFKIAQQVEFVTAIGPVLRRYSGPTQIAYYRHEAVRHSGRTLRRSGRIVPRLDRK